MIGEILLVQKNLRHSSTLKVDVGILEIKKKMGLRKLTAVSSIKKTFCYLGN